MLAALDGALGDSRGERLGDPHEFADVLLRQVEAFGYELRGYAGIGEPQHVPQPEEVDRPELLVRLEGVDPYRAATIRCCAPM